MNVSSGCLLVLDYFSLWRVALLQAYRAKLANCKQEYSKKASLLPLSQRESGEEG